MKVGKSPQTSACRACDAGCGIDWLTASDTASESILQCELRRYALAARRLDLPIYVAPHLIHPQNDITLTEFHGSGRSGD